MATWKEYLTEKKSDDKQLWDAVDRVKRLMKSDMGFSLDVSIGRALKEFPKVDKKELEMAVNGNFKF